MNCPNCGHANKEGAVFCANCGSPLPSSVPPVVSTPADPVGLPPAVAPLPDSAGLGAPQPSSSGMAKAGLWLGISSIAMIVLTVLAVIVLSFTLIDKLDPGMLEDIQRNPSPENIERLIGQGQLEQIGMMGLGIVGCCLLAELCALLGLIFGIVGLSQESSRPTRSGRTHSIIGIVLGALPLMCCVVYFMFALIQRT